jgi:hypothetical protein
MLEEQLERIDSVERAALFLGSSRDDTNDERRTVLSGIDAALADYGAVGLRPLCQTFLLKPRALK